MSFWDYAKWVSPMGYAMFGEEAPKAPNPEEFGPNSEEMRKILQSQYAGIDAKTAGELTNMRASLASRGLFKSGQLPAMEASLRGAGMTAKQNLLSQLTAQGVASRDDYKKRLYELKYQDYMAKQQAMGQLAGTAMQAAMFMI